MTDESGDMGRRRFLVGATSVAGAAGVALLATPYVFSMLPSARARAAGAPVEVDISGVEPGMMITQEWRGQPIWIVNRTLAMMAQLPKNTPLLADPDSRDSDQPESCRNPDRSMASRPNWLVLVGICTHLGCSPLSKMKMGPDSGMGNDWPGGFFCPCHGSKYDLSGRVFKNVPAPRNLRVPPYVFVSDTKLIVGKENKGESS